MHINTQQEDTSQGVLLSDQKTRGKPLGLAHGCRTQAKASDPPILVIRSVTRSQIETRAGGSGQTVWRRGRGFN